jgi:hypothetical protein
MVLYKDMPPACPYECRRFIFERVSRYCSSEATKQEEVYSSITNSACGSIPPHVKTTLPQQAIFRTFFQTKSTMNYQLVTGRPEVTDYLVLTTTFTHNDVFYKAALAETISWEGHLTGTYDVLLQSGKGTQRLTLVKRGEQWRTGEEVEQIGHPEQAVVDLLGAVINQVRSKKPFR